MKRAITTFHAADNVTVVEGSLYDEKAEIVGRYPTMFEDAGEAATRLAERSAPVVFRATPVVEQATAAPGEKRSTKRPD